MPFLLLILVGLALALVFWGFSRQRKHRNGIAVAWTQDGLLVGALIVAAFALGVFLTYGICFAGKW